MTSVPENTVGFSNHWYKSSINVNNLHGFFHHIKVLDAVLCNYEKKWKENYDLHDWHAGNPDKKENSNDFLCNKQQMKMFL